MGHCPEFWFREAEGRVTALDWEVLGGEQSETKDNRLPHTWDSVSSQHPLSFSLPHSGTIPPIKSAQGEGDDVKKLFTIGCPVILATLGVALLFVVRKKRKEKRLKRLRGEGLFYQLPGREVVTPSHTGHPSVDHRRTWAGDQSVCALRGRPATQTFLSLLNRS